MRSVRRAAGGGLGAPGMSGGTAEGLEQHQEQHEEQQQLPRTGKSLPILTLRQNGLLQALVQSVEQPEGAELSEELQRVREEWEAVEEIQTGLGATPAGSAALISFHEALRHFQASDLSEWRKKVPATRPRRGLAALLRCCLGPPRLQAQLQGEWDLALALAQGALDDEDEVHMRILQTIYMKLTRTRLGCPRYGEHWEELGFQGEDPGTDLRGMGLLGLMQLLYFLTDTRMLPLALEIFKLSQHEAQGFPFSLMSLNISRLVLQALREDRLSRECNRRQEVLAVLNDLYVSAFLRLSRLWKRQHKTLLDSDSVLRELDFCVKKKPKQLLRSLEAYVKLSPVASGEEMDFTGVCDPRLELEGEAQLL